MGTPALNRSRFPWMRSWTLDSIGESHRSIIPVAVEPGLTQLARIPLPASSRASTFVNAATPALATQ